MSSPDPPPSTQDPDPDPYPQDPVAEDDIDAPVEDADMDIDMTAAPDQAPPGANFDSNNNPLDSLDPPPDPRIPTRKDMSLREFLGKMDEYAPIIPDAVTSHHLTLAGLPPPPATSSQPADPSIPHTPLQLSRLLALATQKFIADIAADAYQYSRMRSSNTTSNNPINTLGIVGAGGAGSILPQNSAASSSQNPGPGGVGGGGLGGEGGQGGGNKKGGAAGAGGNASHVLGVQRAGFGGGGQGGSGQGRTVLTMEDLGMAVGEYGVNLRRGEFYR
ncbi:hypothetical protein MMC08_001454 [Hypocenomyce scalaris]|nr:hypothetical protein [Hypocenomyce scalaris]